MKKFYLIIVLSMLFVFQGCEEQSAVEKSSQTPDLQQLIGEAKAWYHDVPASTTPKNARDLNSIEVLWDKTKVHRYSKDRFILNIPVISTENSKRASYQLVVFQDRKATRGLIIGVIPDKKYLRKEKDSHDRTFSGQIKIISRTGKKIRTQKFVDGIEVDFYAGNSSTFRTASGEDDWWDDGEATWLDEVVVVGDSWEDDDSWVWVDDPWDDYDDDYYDDDYEDDYWYYDDYNNDGNGDIGIPVAPAFTVGEGGDPNAVPIANINNHLSCFNAQASATITIYVDQPANNSGTCYTGISNVGHSFLGIHQGDNTRTIGFYPAGITTPLAPSDPAQFRDNAGKGWDVSVTFTVSGEELSELLNYTLNDTPDTYDLDVFNCTDWVVAAVESMGIDLPENEGSWPGGGGLCPGQFGQDMRNFTLSDRDVTVSGQNETGNSAANSGTCN